VAARNEPNRDLRRNAANHGKNTFDLSGHKLQLCDINRVIHDYETAAGRRMEKRFSIQLIPSSMKSRAPSGVNEFACRLKAIKKRIAAIVAQWKNKRHPFNYADYRSEPAGKHS